MRVVEITHEVKDYTVWKNGFDEHGDVRNSFGLETIEVLTSPENRNLVTVVIEEQISGGFDKFMNDSDVKEIMKTFGVISEPKIKYFIRDLV